MPPPIPAEDEFVEVAVKGEASGRRDRFQRPSFRIGEDAMDPRHDACAAILPTTLGW